MNWLVPSESKNEQVKSLTPSSPPLAGTREECNECQIFKLTFALPSPFSQCVCTSVLGLFKWKPLVVLRLGLDSRVGSGGPLGMTRRSVRREAMVVVTGNLREGVKAGYRE